MALVVKDRVKETTATTGTGTLTLAGAVTGFQSFSSALSNGDTTYYAIFESSTGEWEVGLGTFTASGTTLARTTVLASSNAGSAVNLTAGSAEVFITQPATKSAYFDGSGDLVLNQDPTSALQAATKQYVDTIAAAGIHYHDPVRVEQEGNLNATYDNGTSGVGATLTNAGTQAALVIDGVTMVLNDRVLIYEQTNAAHNGVYTVTNVGSASTNWVLTRATDADSYGPSDPDALGQGDAFFVSEGAAGAGETYVMTTEGTITFGTTNITFSQISATQIYSAGGGLTLTGTTFAAGAGTGVTVNANDIAIGQSVGTGDTVTFATVNANLTGDVTGNADTATALETARTIGGVSFDGTANINLPGVNTAGNQNTTGNAATATALATGRTISLTGDVTGTSGSFDGSGNVSIAATIAANSVALGTDTTGNYVADITAGNLIDVSGGGSETATVTVNVDLSELTTSTSDGDGDFFVVVDSVNAQKKLTKANINISGFNNDAGYTTNVGDITGVTAGSYITGGGTSGTVTVNVDATSANTASKVVARDASGNFSAGTITAALNGNASTATSATNADTVDSLHASQFLRSDANDTATGELTFNAKLDVANNTYLGWGGGTNRPSITGNKTSSLMLHYTGGSERLRVYDSGIDVTGTVTADHVQVAGTVYHEGDTDTYLGFDTNLAYLTVGGSQEITVTSTGVQLGDTGNGYFQPVSGSFGSIQIDGGAHGGYEGYSIGGRAVFMHDNVNSTGIYDDVNNDWMFYGVHGAGTYMYYNGAQKFNTTNTGANINGDLNAVDNIYVASNIYHEGDTDTRINFGTNHINFYAGGTETLEVWNSGTYNYNVYYEDYDALSGTSVTVNCDTAQAFSLTMTGNTTFTFNGVTNAWATGFVLELTGNGSTVTWPASVDWAGGAAPDAPASGETDIYVFWTRDGGTTWYGILSIDAAA